MTEKDDPWGRPLRDLLISRRSIRRYLPDPVEREKIHSCLEAARIAPSAENSQPWRFVVVDDPAVKEDLGKKAFSGIYSMCRFAAEAPVLVVILAKPHFVANQMARAIQGTQFYLLDIGISGEHFVLQAEDLGLSTCWIGWFNARKTRKILNIPRTHKVVAMISVGYAASRPQTETKRKPLEEIVRFNGF